MGLETLKFMKEATIYLWISRSMVTFVIVVSFSLPIWGYEIVRQHSKNSLIKKKKTAFSTINAASKIHRWTVNFDKL